MEQTATEIIINLLAQEIASLKAQLKAQSESGQNGHDALAEELATVKEELATTTRELATATGELATAKEELASVSRELRHKTRALNKLETENEELKQKLEDTESDVDVELAPGELEAFGRRLGIPTATTVKKNTAHVSPRDNQLNVTKTVPLVSRHQLVQLSLPGTPPPLDLKPIGRAIDIIYSQIGEVGNIVSRTSYVRVGRDTVEWCSERPQHGFFVRISGNFTNTSPTLLRRPLGQRVEIFEHRQLGWFYIGTYVLVNLPPITPLEYTNLPPGMQSQLIQQSISSAGFAANAHQQLKTGGIKVLCVGLRCIGFNYAFYETLLAKVEQSPRKKRKLDSDDDSEEEQHDSRKGSVKAVGVVQVDSDTTDSDSDTDSDSG